MSFFFYCRIVWLHCYPYTLKSHHLLRVFFLPYLWGSNLSFVAQVKQTNMRQVAQIVGLMMTIERDHALSCQRRWESCCGACGYGISLWRTISLYAHLAYFCTWYFLFFKTFKFVLFLFIYYFVRIFHLSCFGQGWIWFWGCRRWTTWRHSVQTLGLLKTFQLVSTGSNSSSWYMVHLVCSAEIFGK